MIKPWGFAPAKGDPVKFEDEEEQKTYAEAPYYSYVPKDTEMQSYRNSNICFANLENRHVLTVNMGKRRMVSIFAQNVEEQKLQKLFLQEIIIFRSRIMIGIYAAMKELWQQIYTWDMNS